MTTCINPSARHSPTNWSEPSVVCCSNGASNFLEIYWNITFEDCCSPIGSKLHFPVTYPTHHPVVYGAKVVHNFGAFHREYFWAFNRGTQLLKYVVKTISKSPRFSLVRAFSLMPNSNSLLEENVFFFPNLASNIQLDINISQNNFRK